MAVTSENDSSRVTRESTCSLSSIHYDPSDSSYELAVAAITKSLRYRVESRDTDCHLLSIPLETQIEQLARILDLFTPAQKSEFDVFTYGRAADDTQATDAKTHIDNALQYYSLRVIRFKILNICVRRSQIQPITDFERDNISDLYRTVLFREGDLIVAAILAANTPLIYRKGEYITHEYAPQDADDPDMYKPVYDATKPTTRVSPPVISVEQPDWSDEEPDTQDLAPDIPVNVEPTIYVAATSDEDDDDDDLDLPHHHQSTFSATAFARSLVIEPADPHKNMPMYKRRRIFTEMAGEQ